MEGSCLDDPDPDDAPPREDEEADDLVDRECTGILIWISGATI